MSTDIRRKDKYGLDTTGGEIVKIALDAQMRTWRASPDENKTVSSLCRRVAA